MKNILKIAEEILDKQWGGPDGVVWCEGKKKFVRTGICDDCLECQTEDVGEQRIPSRYW